MADAVAHWTTTIGAMALAFGAGDNPRGEELLLTALDLGALWDVVTTAAARALVGYRAGESAPSKPDGLPNEPALTHHIVAAARPHTADKFIA
jgi:hypothetical protein